MIRYSVTMGIRIVCVFLCVFVRGWWLVVCAAGAIFLPYIAVVLANVIDTRVSKVERPDAMKSLEAPHDDGPSNDGPSNDGRGEETPQDGAR